MTSFLRIREEELKMLYMRVVGTGMTSSRGKNRQGLKDYVMTHGSKLCFCKQDFSHNLSSQSQAEEGNSYPVHPFHSTSALLSERRGKTGRDSREMKQEKPLSVSLEGRRMWEQMHVQDVAVGHCCDIPCVVEELRPHR